MSSSSSSFTDDELTKQLQLLKTQLNKKQTFESAVSNIKSLLLSSYSSSSPPTQSLFYDVISRVVTVSRTRYTSPPFLHAAANLLSTAQQFFTTPSQHSHLQSSLSFILQNLPQQQPPPPPQINNNNTHQINRNTYLFEGHLTVDREPPQPNWLLQQNLLLSLAQNQNQSQNSDDQTMRSLFVGLAESLEESMIENLEDFFPADETTRRVAPPASKAVVEKLRVVKVDEEKAGEDVECCICKERLGVGDEMQEMPCKHLFHPVCLKPWLDEHNSCPICRHELPTDDHKYESWKEREKELEEERRGAANAVRGGEFMYI